MKTGDVVDTNVGTEKATMTPQTPSPNTRSNAMPTPIYKHYVATFVDIEGGRWVLLITYPNTEATKDYPDTQVVTLGVPPVTLSFDRESALAPVAEGRLSFSIMQDKPSRDYRHLMQASEGSVSVMLLHLPPTFRFTSDEDLKTIPEELYLDSDGWEKGFWRGTLDPESYKEPGNQHSGYLVSFEAVDLGRLKRIELKQTDEHMKIFSPRMDIRDFIAALLSLSFTDPERAMLRSGGPSAEKITLAQMVWCAQHFTDGGNDLYLNTTPFFADSEKPLTAFVALERVLSSFTLSIEQAGGLWVISDPATLQRAEKDKYIFSALNEDGFLTLEPEALQAMESDGELSALPARGQLTLTTVPHMAEAIPAFQLPKISDEAKWHLVPRADTRLRLPAWRYRTNYEDRPDFPGVTRLDSEEVSKGEDRQLFMLLWNPQSIHGRIDDQTLVKGQHGYGWSIFLTDEVGWEYSPEINRYLNRSLRAVNEHGEIELLTHLDDENKWHYVSISSFSATTVIPESKLPEYIARLSHWCDRLNAPLDSPGLSLNGFNRWRFDLPSVADKGGLSLRLDLPLLLSMGQDLYQDLNEKNYTLIDLTSDGPSGRQFGRIDYLQKAKEQQKYIQMFTDRITGCRLSFGLAAKGEAESDPVQYLTISIGGALGWSDSDPKDSSALPYIFYGSYDDEDKLKWGTSWNHPNIGAEDFLGEGLHIPLPPKAFHHLELTVYTLPHFYHRKDNHPQHYREWSLWSVPSIIALQAPALWLADALGRKESDLAPDRKERYRFTQSTDEGIDEELHLSDGTGLPTLAPAIVRTADGTPLNKRHRTTDDYFSQYTLSGYRAECFGAVYGSLPDRGFELTGTFRYRPEIARSTYMGLNWLTISREIDIQQMTERGTYHQLRPTSAIRPESLKPEVIEGRRSRGETYDTTSPRYVERGNRPPQRRR
nr:MAG TPA: hypothetical protein [Caudoviricetes sp.]